MKTSAIGIVSAAILMVVAGVGLGTAQAGGMHTNSPSYGFADQEPLQVVNAPEEDMDLAGPIGTGKLPNSSNANSSHELQEVESDGVTFYLSGGKQYGPD